METTPVIATPVLVWVPMGCIARGESEAMSSSRQIVFHNPRYPDGSAELLAWDCDETSQERQATFLCRSSGAYFVFREPAPPGSDAVTMIAREAARGVYDRYRAKVCRDIDAFPDAQALPPRAS